jgi:peroxiredoxin-like protein
MEQAARRTHTFALHARWAAGERVGEVALSGGQSAAISIPAAFGGNRPGTNPEELLLAAALSCYLMTLARILEQRQLGTPVHEGQIVGEVSRTREGLHLDRIRLRPVVDASPAGIDREQLLQALHDAEDACFIAQVLRPVVPYSLEPLFVAATEGGLGAGAPPAAGRETT